MKKEIIMNIKATLSKKDPFINRIIVFILSLGLTRCPSCKEIKRNTTMIQYSGICDSCMDVLDKQDV